MRIQQLGLFENIEKSEILRDLHGIQGLYYCSDLLSKVEQCRSSMKLIKHPWMQDLKRQVQHYGYKYDYKARRVDPSMYVGPLPGFANEIAQKLLDRA